MPTGEDWNRAKETSMRLKTVAVLMLALAALLLVAGCGSKKKKASASTTSTTPTTTTKAVGAPGATVSFVTPKNGATVGNTVAAKGKLSGFRLAPSQGGQAAKHGDAHL